MVDGLNVFGGLDVGLVDGFALVTGEIEASVAILVDLRFFRQFSLRMDSVNFSKL
jgi:hypothetical protein